ncbi:MAG: hypothetical protein SCALA702_20870 [Melioribacteraceae bacterium]|nr:MAG: hypothetical protein SCALA702_20870 [Melioribacteraceae bacterium]
MKKIAILFFILSFSIFGQSVLEDIPPFFIHDMDTIGTEIYILKSEMSGDGKEILSWQTSQPANEGVFEAVVLDNENNELGRISYPLTEDYYNFEFTFSDDIIYGIGDNLGADNNALQIYKFNYAGELLEINTLSENAGNVQNLSAKTSESRRSYFIYEMYNKIYGSVYNSEGIQIKAPAQILDDFSDFYDFTTLPNDRIALLSESILSNGIELKLLGDTLNSVINTELLNYNNFQSQKSKIISDDSGNIYVVIQSKEFNADEYFTLAKFSSNLDFIDSVQIPFEDILNIDRSDYDINCRNDKIVFSIMNADGVDRILTASIFDTNLNLLSQDIEITTNYLQQIYASPLNENEISYSYLKSKDLRGFMIERTITDYSGNIVKPQTLILNNRTCADQFYAGFTVQNDSAFVFYREQGVEIFQQPYIAEIDFSTGSYSNHEYSQNNLYSAFTEPSVLKFDDRIISAFSRFDTLTITIFDSDLNILQNLMPVIEKDFYSDFSPEMVKMGDDKFGMIYYKTGENAGYYIQVFDKDGAKLGDEIPFEYNWHGKATYNDRIHEHYLESTGTIFSFVSYNHFEFLLLNEDGVPQSDSLIRVYPEIDDFNIGVGIVFLNSPSEIITILYGRLGSENTTFIVKCDIEGNITSTRELAELDIPDVYSGPFRTDYLKENVIVFAIDEQSTLSDPYLICYNLDTEKFSNRKAFFARNDSVYLHDYKLQTESDNIYLLLNYANNSTYRQDFDLAIGKYCYDPVLGVIEESNPESWSLSQNYPNPFNPETTINFTLAKPGTVKLTIYNTLGQQVETLINGELAAGNHDVQFDGTNLASGIYLYKLETSEFKSTKKMILMK